MTPKQKLQSVLEYTEKLLSLGEKIIFDVTTASITVFPEHELIGQEGITTNGVEDTWIQLRRIRETKPPPYPDLLNGWIKEEARPSPDRQPQLVSERCLRLTEIEISELHTIGALLPDDILHPVVPDPDGKLDAILRIENMPNLSSEWTHYIGGPWLEWAAKERPRRRSINLYNRLYQIHQRMVSFGEDNPIELVLGCGIALWNISEQKIIVPIIEQLLESNLDESGTISLSPRTLNPIINLKSFHALDIEGSESVQREATSLLTKIIEDPDTEFSPFNPATFDKILRTCAAKLSPTGRYFTDETTTEKVLPPPTPELFITESWIIFARQRTEDVRRDDIRRLMSQVEETKDESDLPPAAKKFVEPPSDQKLYGTDFDLGNTSLELPDVTKSNPRWSSQSGELTSAARQPDDPEKKNNFFFPLPFNEDQVAIAQALIDADGVVVQGPPGTGKTHTIANIICHYLATGRRVLVTAKTPEALTALQEKLPEGIRNLAISIIHNDREGSRQLETAMRIISDEIKQIHPHQVEQELKDKQSRIAAIRIRIRAIESILLDVAKSNLSEVAFNGENMTPMKIAQFVADTKAVHAWFPDKLTPVLSQRPEFTTSHIENARALRSAIGVDLQYPTSSISTIHDLPPLHKVIDAHEKLQEYQIKKDALERGDIPFMSTDREDAWAQARDLREYLEGLIEFYETVSKSDWMKALTTVLSRYYSSATGAPPELLLLLQQWIDLSDRGQSVLELAPESVILGIADSEVDGAIEELCAGRNPFGLLKFGKSQLRDLVHSMRIGGNPPESRDDWLAIRNCRLWYKDVQAYRLLWDRSSQAFGLPRHAQDLLAAGKVLVNGSELIKQTVRFIVDIPARRRQAGVLFPYGFNLDLGLTNEAILSLLEAIAANIAREDIAVAMNSKSALAAMNRNASLPFDRTAEDLAQLIGTVGIAQHEIARGWQALSAELTRLSLMRDKMELLDEISKAVKRSGAPQWAKMLRSQPDMELSPSLTPTTWEDSWNWAKAEAFISSITSPDKLRTLIAEQSELESEQKRLFTDIVRLRTFLGLKVTITDRVQAALSKFSSAIGKLGSGTGKSASRYRRIIRSSTMEAAHAIPCWILPEWRVSEQIPSELALFDLVVVDEASQSDITALPAILRGKKVLIVGDDKQVSPSTIGIEERQIIQLRTTFLTGIPNADQMDPGSSLYELASAVFPARAIMLREHFRCVEPIIRFSSQFYPQPLVPLRLPTASERLTPPLIDIFVRRGAKIRDTNKAEADVIVAEIAKIAKDESMSGRSIGVISLIGDKQAKLIYDLIIRELGTETIDRHRIMCGNAAAFQGQERNIIFLSMVECQKTATAKTTRIFAQRFNVAMSRARDRVYLVRSVSSSDLQPTDLSCTRFRRHQVRCFMEQEVRHGEKAVYTGVQA